MADREAAQALADRLMGRGSRTADTAAEDMILEGLKAREAAAAEPEVEEEPYDDFYDRQDQGDDPDDEPDSEEGGEELPDEDTGDDEAEQEVETETAEDEGEQETADTGEFLYSDDDILEVMVDGEAHEVSLRDLKAAYSGEGAISKRLKEATEARKAAYAERQAVADEIATHRENLARTLGQLDGLIFAPLVEPPDPKLRATDMQQYLMHKDAYEEDQKRIIAGRQQVQYWLGQQHQDTEKRRQEIFQHETEQLMQAAPELRNKDTAPKFTRYVEEAVKTYGFTPEEVSSVLSHKLFLMARDAGKWIAMQKAKTTGNVPPTSGEKKPRKLMKAGNGGSITARKLATKASQKEVQQATAKARASGKTDDVAAMLLAKAKPQNKAQQQTGGRRGR